MRQGSRLCVQQRVYLVVADDAKVIRVTADVSRRRSFAEGLPLLVSPVSGHSVGQDSNVHDDGG